MARAALTPYRPRSIQQQGSAGNFTGMAQACAELSSAVSNTEAAGPIPYRPAERWFARGLAKYDQAASECQAGASSQDATAMQRAATDFSEGNADVARADKTIKALSGA